MTEEEAEGFQNSLRTIFESSEQKSLTDEQQQESRKLNQSFQKKKNNTVNTKIWDMVQSFYSEEGSFKFKELETIVQDEVRPNYPLPVDASEEERLKRDKKVETIVRDKLKIGKVYTKSKDDRQKYLSEKAEYKVEKAITRVMHGYPGIILRGVQNNKRKSDSLKKIIGREIVPNCS